MRATVMLEGEAEEVAVVMASLKANSALQIIVTTPEPIAFKEAINDPEIEERPFDRSYRFMTLEEMCDVMRDMSNPLQIRFLNLLYWAKHGWVSAPQMHHLLPYYPAGFKGFMGGFGLRNKRGKDYSGSDEKPPLLFDQKKEGNVNYYRLPSIARRAMRRTRIQQAGDRVIRSDQQRTLLNATGPELEQALRAAQKAYQDSEEKRAAVLQIERLAELSAKRREKIADEEREALAADAACEEPKQPEKPNNPKLEFVDLATARHVLTQQRKQPNPKPENLAVLQVLYRADDWLSVEQICKASGIGQGYFNGIPTSWGMHIKPSHQNSDNKPVFIDMKKVKNKSFYRMPEVVRAAMRAEGIAGGKP